MEFNIHLNSASRLWPLGIERNHFVIIYKDVYQDIVKVYLIMVTGESSHRELLLKYICTEGDTFQKLPLK